MNVGVIGCGMIAKKAHLPAYRSLENVNIIAVSDIEKRRAKSIAKEFGASKWFTDYHELLKEDLDLVSICTPIFTHAQIAKDVAKAGINVLVEKPMATNLQEADEMIDACKRSGVQLCVLHNFRYVPSLLDAKKRIVEGRIGRIVSIHATSYGLIPMSWSHSSWFYYKWGLLEDIGIHMIDAVNFLCDSELEDVRVVARDYTDNMEFFNHILSIMLFKSKATAFLDLSWVSGCVESSLKVQGTGGMLNIDVRNNHIQEIHGYSTPLEELKSNAKKSFRTMKAALDKTYFRGTLLYHRQIIEDFISSITDGKQPPVLGEDGRKAVAVMDAIKHSLDSRLEKGSNVHTAQTEME
jgi:UDP-N-acetylglucosamine 3-dehydrogenase